jgi:mono/diheme cytochrome c family protein
MLKVFEGPLEVVGTVILPTLAILALILTPFIDRSAMVRVRQRTLAMGVVLLAAIGWGGLTAAAIKSTPPQTAASSIDFSGPTQWMQLKPAELSGIHFFKEEKCGVCHNVLPGGEAKAGPNLINTGRRHDKDWMLLHFKEPEKTSPGSAMAPVNLNTSQLNDLAASMAALTPDNGDLISSTPDFAASGAALYQKNFCFACHAVNGVGGKTGPVLNGLATRRTEAWTREHFSNPQKMSPGTPMPPYKFSNQDMDAMVSYLFTLPNKPPTP